MKANLGTKRQRKQYGAAMKAKAAIQGEQTANEIASLYGVHLRRSRDPRGNSSKKHLISLMTFRTFCSPYAGEFFEATFPESSPLPWPSRSLRRSALPGSPCGAKISTLFQRDSFGAGFPSWYRLLVPTSFSEVSFRFTTPCHHGQWKLATWLSGDYHDPISSG